MRRSLAAALAVCLPALSPAADPVEFKVGAFSFNRPAEFRWVPSTSPMRKAQLAVASGEGGAGEIVFFHFGPGQGGGVQANVDRWLAQFAPREHSAQRTEEVEGRKVTFVEATGTFQSGMPGAPPTPMNGFALRGAILESNQGDVYVKFTGPAPMVVTATPAFEAMVRGAMGAP